MDYGHVMKEGVLYALFDDSGSATGLPNSFHGIYKSNTRYLDRIEWSLGDFEFTPIHRDTRSGYFHRYILTNRHDPDFRFQSFPGHALQLTVEKGLSDRSYAERLTLTNLSEHRIEEELTFLFRFDFSDVAEVRGMLPAEEQRRIETKIETERMIHVAYDGKDGFHAEATLQFTRPFAISKEGRLQFFVALEPKACFEVEVSIDFGCGATSVAEATTEGVEEYRQWCGSCAQIETDHATLNAALAQNLNDLRLLHTPAQSGRAFFAAGVPQFVASFGRDSILTCFSLAWLNHELCRAVLRELAQHQGRVSRSLSEEQPGKIHHEIRYGERFSKDSYPYTYASIDATPLFVMLIDEYFAWSGDRDLLSEMMPAITAALEWCSAYGDLDGDGFLEYDNPKEGRLGLTHRGWKDGEPLSVSDSAGRIPAHPIAMVEFQGYYHAALKGAARLMRVCGHECEANDFEQTAESLRASFRRSFGHDAQGTLAMALDGAKRPVLSIGSNQGHCLLSDLVEPERIGRMALRFLEEDMYNGFGIRTLSTKALAYSPYRYQRGAVWPHDTAFIAWGLKSRAQDRAAQRIASGLLDAATLFPDYRMPEYFAGIDRSQSGDRPVPLPGACLPQAWAAASPFLALRTLLGLLPDAQKRILTLRPSLPSGSVNPHRITVRNLRFLDGSVDFTVEGRGAELTTHIDRKDGNFEFRVEPCSL